MFLVTGEEELTFEEGQIIRVLSKCAHSIDDGWWQGELEDRIGNFPSLVVEECDEFGEPLTNQWDESPPQSAPPVFTPPEIPSYLVDSDLDGTPEFVSSPPTQPPPPMPNLEEDEEESPKIVEKEVEEASEKKVQKVEEEQINPSEPITNETQPAFAISMSRDQHSQYGSQFSSKQTIPSKLFPYFRGLPISISLYLLFNLIRSIYIFRVGIFKSG